MKRRHSDDAMEPRRHLRGGCRPCARPAVPDPRRAGDHVGRVRPAGQRPRCRPARRRPHPAVEGRPVPLQLHRVPRVDGRRVQGLGRPGEHQLPLRAGGDPLPVRQRRRRGRGVPRLVHRAARRDPRPAAEGAPVVRRRRRGRRRSGVGDSVRVGGRCRRRSPERTVAAQWRRPPAAVHRRHDRHAQGRDVAPGRSGQRARCRRQRGARPPRRRVGRRAGRADRPGRPDRTS